MSAVKGTSAVLSDAQLHFRAIFSSGHNGLFCTSEERCGCT